MTFSLPFHDFASSFYSPCRPPHLHQHVFLPVPPPYCGISILISLIYAAAHAQNYLRQMPPQSKMAPVPEQNLIWEIHFHLVSCSMKMRS